MQSDELTREQCEAIKAKTRPMLRYINQLQARMIHCGFLHRDPLLQRVRDAATALHALNVELHYLSCGGGVGRPDREGGGRE